MCHKSWPTRWHELQRLGRGPASVSSSEVMSPPSPISNFPRCENVDNGHDSPLGLTHCQEASQ